MRAAIVLAAGRSHRFRGENKLLVRFHGRRLLDHAIAAARAAPVGRILVVVGHDRWRVARHGFGPRATMVVARDHAEGLAASLRAGLRALWPSEREIFVFLGDMPTIPAALPGRLARALRPGTEAARPRGRGGPGHPVLLRRPAREIIERLGGDSGLGALIAGQTRWIMTTDRRSTDIDTRRDLSRRR